MIKTILFFLAILIFLIAYTKYYEAHNVFFPSTNLELTPKAINLNYEDVFFKTSDNQLLNGWFLPSDDARYTFLFCHGNAGNIADRLYKLQALNQLGVNVFIFDYRGFGKSQGKPSEKGIYNDAMAAYDYLITQKAIHPDTIIAYGVSLGGAVAIDLCSKVPCAGLIVEGTFSSGKDMAKRIFPILPCYIFVNSYNSQSKISTMTIPKLILHSTDDEVVPSRLGKKLFGAAAGPKEFVELNGYHDDAFFESNGTYMTAIKNFLNTL